MYNNSYTNANFGGYNPQMQNYAQNFQNNVQNTSQMQFSPTNIQNNLNIIRGKLIENEDIAKTIEVPMDGSQIFLPLIDGSKIIAKQLLPNGTTKYTIYDKKIENEPEKEKISLNDIQNEILKINNDDIKEILNGIKDEIKSLKKAGKQ